MTKDNKLPEGDTLESSVNQSPQERGVTSKAELTRGWREEFNRRTDPDNYEKSEFHRLVEGNDSLLDRDNYPESPYELDRDKVAEFIEQTISKELEKQKEELTKKKPKPDLIEGQLLFSCLGWDNNRIVINKVLKGTNKKSLLLRCNIGTDDEFNSTGFGYKDIGKTLFETLEEAKANPYHG